MKAVMVEDSVRVFPEPTAETLSIATLHKGDEIELGKVKRKKKDVWVETILPGGQVGYISGSTKIFIIRKVQVQKRPLDLYEAPDESSRILTTLEPKTEFTVNGVEKGGEKDWVKAVTAEGLKGYIIGDSKIRVVPEVTKASARKGMITGGVFALVGVAFLVADLVQKRSSADTSFLVLGLLALGLFQFVQGYLQWRRLNAGEKDKK